MAGLTREGFIPLTYSELRTRIQSQLEVFSPGFDFSPESPDGQLVDIMSFLLAQNWSELNLVYRAYDPNQAVGAALRNLGLITGKPFGVATRSSADVKFTAPAGTFIPRGSIVTRSSDNAEFDTTADLEIGTSGFNVVECLSLISGPQNVDAGTIDTMQTAIPAVTAVTNEAAGRVGSSAQTEAAFRNERNRTVLRNFVSVPEIMEARLFELGIEQAFIVNNDTDAVDGDGVPSRTIHVTVGEYPQGVSDEDVALVILATKGLGTPTFGANNATVKDAQGYDHVINFTKATPVNIFMDIVLEWGNDDIAGAEEGIKEDLVNHINSLATGEDVIRTRLYGIITPYGKANVTTLDLGTSVVTATTDITISDTEYAICSAGNINLITS